MKEVCIAWATKKRHIAIDRKVLCEPLHKTTGYSVSNGQYNSLTLSGLPTYPKITDDAKFTHGDGIIEYKPLNQQKFKIISTSICSKCLSKYKKEF